MIGGIGPRIRRPRHPVRSDRTSADLGGPAPVLGRHTDEIPTEAGLGAEIAVLLVAGVVA